MSRYKVIIGPRLRARSLWGQRAEAAIGVACSTAGCTPHGPTPSATRPALLEIDGQRDPSPEPRSHATTPTIGLYDRRAVFVNLDKVERIVI